MLIQLKLSTLLLLEDDCNCCAGCDDQNDEHDDKTDVGLLSNLSLGLSLSCGSCA